MILKRFHITEFMKNIKSKISQENDELQRKGRRKQCAFAFKLVSLLFSWGEALFLNVPHLHFLGRGDFQLGPPLTEICGAMVKTFHTALQNEIIFGI